LSVFVIDVPKPKAALLLLALTATCRPSARSAPDPVILALDEQVVRRSDFDRHVATLEARGGLVEPEVRRALLEPWLEERVQVLEARQRGLLKEGASPEEELRAVQRLLAECSQVVVSEEEIDGYYRAHAAEFQVPETVTLRQILVPSLNEARDAQRRLQKAPRDFENLAVTVSRGPEAAKGGLMGTFTRGQLPAELEAAAFAVPEGGVSEIVESSLGFHILKVESRQAAREESLDQARLRIRVLLEREKADRNVRQFVSDLMARAKVNHEAAILPARSS
jgi:parvulin-like peptidyl-prolyl isomerase